MALLHERLALSDFVTGLLGGDADDLAAALRNADEGEGPDGRTWFYGAVKARNGRLRLDDGQLERYDANILAHQRQIALHRPGFRLRYFQYLAALYTEALLDRLARDPAALLLAVEAHRAEQFSDLPPFTADTLRTLAFWMATGSGKTLLMHVGILQALDYFPGRFQNVLLVVPTETLRDQHLEELTASGLRAAYALGADALRAQVQVVEITKLYVEGEGRQRGGVSRPTSEFEGPNLLLVDEGHKGSKTKSDQKTERQWRAIRDDLAGAGGPPSSAGLVFEYSATFAQVTDKDPELFDDYARQTLYEYAYRRFHGDGFGKDYQVMNVRQDPDLYGDQLLLGGLLTFYEKQRLFDETPTAASVFREAPPLMVFVSSRVTGGPELVTVLEFLDRVLRDPEWARAQIAALLRGESGLPGPDGRDAFALSFPFLRSLAPGDLYGDLCQRLFYGTGRLTLVPLADAPGEIGLRTADAAKDRFFGVVNVGDADKLAKKVAAETDVAVSDETPFTGSLFDTVGDDASQLRFLVGSKKFTEGWSTPRVSVMGLMSVGASAGAQVLQLFGRGVRLRGYLGGMRRAGFVTGATPPPHLDRLETLDIFGVKANYLKRFLDMLRREGAPVPVLRSLPLFVDAAIASAGLQTLRVRDGYRFDQAETVQFDPDAIQRTVALDLTPKLEVGTATQTEGATVGLRVQKIPDDTLDLLDWDGLYYHALAHKQRRGWANVQVDRAAVERAIRAWTLLAAPDEVRKPRTLDHLQKLDAAARTLLEKAMDAHYKAVREREEKSRLVAYPLAADDPNVPTLTVREDGASREVPAYQLKVPESMLDAVDALLADLDVLRQESKDRPVPRMHVAAHLYDPLLVDGTFDVGAGNWRVTKMSVRVTSTPTGLVESEVRFLHDLRTFWAAKGPEWDGADLFVLRNLPKLGVGFFETAGFYPDFLVWVKIGDASALAFVDPKGLSNWDSEKVGLLQTIRDLSDEVGLSLHGFIVTPTLPENIDVPGVAPADVADHLRAAGVLHMDDTDPDTGYIADLLRQTASALPTGV